MTTRVRGTATAALATLVIVAAQAGAAERHEILAKPLSPGSVALLVEHAEDPRVRARLMEALKDTRPAVRGVAARVVNVTSTRSLLPEVAAALGTETDVAAATEEAEVLVSLGEGGRDEEVLSAARRDARFAPGVALALARVRGPEALRHAFLLATLAEGTGVGRFVELATRRQPAALAEAGSLAVRAGHADVWEAVLDIARAHDVALDEAVLAAGLEAPSPELRAATLWHLVLAASAPPPRVVEVIESSPEGAVPPDHAEARLAFEMVRRRLGHPAREDGAWVAGLREPGSAGAPTELAQRHHALRRLTKTELSAFSERMTDDAKALAKELKESKDDAPGRPPAEEGARTVTLRMPGGFPPEVVSDVMKVSGCSLRREHAFYGGQVSYGPDGRPRLVTLLNPGEVPAECLGAVRALLVLALADSERVNPAGHSDMLIVPLVADVIACLGDEPAAAPRAASLPVGRGRIKEPKKLRHVAPWYPAGARAERVEGRVILEAGIGTSGCIRSVEVIQSRDPRLDLVALLNVAQWRYTPTLLDGVPVPVIMTVTVNFRMR